nr:MAG TPA: hypothetical protein [Bacteriophage sp.]DAZ66835.1 MAG TPA: hypothetical protein [Caudoviricetes sp.]
MPYNHSLTSGTPICYLPIIAITVSSYRRR